MDLFLNKVKEFADTYCMLDVSNVIVGVSGGSDSLALVNVLSEIQKFYSYSLTVVHVNHNIRKGDCDDDQQLTIRECEKLGINCLCYSFDAIDYAKKCKQSIETASREYRYIKFNEVKDKLIGKTRIAIAHHMDDLAETMLMNLFRGAGMEGLVSPTPVNNDIIRPLLCVNKEEIINYLEKRNIQYATDITNYESDCTRNIWRNDIFPLISKVSTKKTSDALLDTYKLLATDLDYINLQVHDVYKKAILCANGRKWLELEKFKNEHTTLVTRVIRKLWLEIFGNLVDFEKIHVDLVMKLINNISDTRSFKMIDLSFGRVFIKYDGKVTFCDKAIVEDVLIDLVNYFKQIFCVGRSIRKKLEEGITDLCGAPFQIKLEKIENNVVLSYNRYAWFYPFLNEGEEFWISNDLGDRFFRKAGSVSNKKLSKVLADKHIPMLIRDFCMGITDQEGKLFWVPGLGHTIGFVDETSKLIFDRQSKDNILGYWKLSLIMKEE